MVEEAQRWFNDAQRDLHRARTLFAAEDWAGTAFYCQQATEKCLKSLLASRGENAWGHELTKLAERVADVYGEPLPGLPRGAAKELERDYTAARYPDAWERGTSYEHYTKEMAEERISWAERVEEFARSRLSPDTATN
jgi:HEPN domain-containing protein